MRVLLDTNVLLSAFGTRGLCADVLREVLARHVLLWCDEVEKELARNLRRKFRLPRPEIDSILAFLEEAAVRAPQVPPVAGCRLDAADGAVLAAAVHGKADVLVTGDARMVEAGGPAPLRVLTPRAFWTRHGGALPPR